MMIARSAVEHDARPHDDDPAGRHPVNGFLPRAGDTGHLRWPFGDGVFLVDDVRPGVAVDGERAHLQPQHRWTGEPRCGGHQCLRRFDP